MATIKESLFDAMYAAKQEVIDIARKPLKRKELQRKFQNAYDNAAGAKLEAEVRLAEQREDLKVYSLQAVINLKQEIKTQEATMDAIAAEYLEVFGTDINA